MSNCYKAIMHRSSHHNSVGTRTQASQWVSMGRVIECVLANKDPTISSRSSHGLFPISSLQLLLLFLYLSLRSLPQKLSSNPKPNKDDVYHLMIYLVPIFVTQKFDRSAVSFCEESDELERKKLGFIQFGPLLFGCNKIRTHYTKKNAKGQNPEKKEIESGDQKIFLILIAHAYIVKEYI